MKVGKGLICIDHSVSPSSLGVGGEGLIYIIHSAPSSLGVGGEGLIYIIHSAPSSLGVGGGGGGDGHLVEGDRGCK